MSSIPLVPGILASLPHDEDSIGLSNHRTNRKATSTIHERLSPSVPRMIARLTVIVLVLATAAGADDRQPQEELEAAKKERMYQEWTQKFREGLARMETNLPAEQRLDLTNLATSAYAEQMSRGSFEAHWIHSSFGLYWNDIPPPTIRGSNATVEVDKFIAENGRHMLSNDWFFLSLVLLLPGAHLHDNWRCPIMQSPARDRINPNISYRWSNAVLAASRTSIGDSFKFFLIFAWMTIVRDEDQSWTRAGITRTRRGT